MLFNSVSFLLFCPVVLAGYYALSLRGQNMWLLVASYFFYGSWDWRFLSLILLSTAVDYAVAARLGQTSRPETRKALLAISVCTNLGILGFFKYFNFFAESMAALLAGLGVDVHMSTLNIVLPVGISFYTFQTLSYTIDIYRRRIQPTRDPLAFALFVAYFPQLVAGPIERASHLLPRLVRPRRVAWPAMAVGVELILIGYLKKVALTARAAPDR